MSLRQKFAFLVGLLALSAVVSVGTAWWSVRLLDRELARPFTRITTALTDLNGLKRNVWEQARLTLGERAGDVPIPESERTFEPPQPRSTEPPAERFAALRESLTERLDALERNEAFLARAGVSAWRTLRTRLEQAERDAGRWWAGDDVASRERAAGELLVIHELLERSEAGVLRDAALAADYGSRVRRVALVVLSFALASAALVASIAFLRLRRWVLRPVRDLRIAASRIARGDFAHRVPAPAPGPTPPNDELTALALEVNHMAGMVSTMQEERVARERLAAVGEMTRRVAHNIRNPLSGIRALAEMARIDLPEGSEIRESQERIIATVDRFEAWLADLIVSTGPLDVNPAPHEVAPWLHGVAETLAPMAEANRVKLVVNTAGSPEEAEFDARHLEQAVVALLTNAIQASPPEGAVTLTSSAAGADRWTLTVKDEGPGIKPELLGRIFDAHFTTKRRGTGMGLAMCRQVVREHGGSVGVLPIPSMAPSDPKAANRGPGAVFVIDLPRRPQPASKAELENGARSGENSDH